MNFFHCVWWNNRFYESPKSLTFFKKKIKIIICFKINQKKKKKYKIDGAFIMKIVPEVSLYLIKKLR